MRSRACRTHDNGSTRVAHGRGIDGYLLDVDGTNAHEFGEASRQGYSVALPVRAEICTATAALGAVPAFDDGVDYDKCASVEVPGVAAELHDGAGDFVARHDWHVRRGVVAVDDVQVGAADTATVDLDDDVRGSGARIVDGG